jgi:hypothetical protein
MDDDVVEIPNVDAMSDTGLTLVCLIGGRRVMVPHLQIHRRSTVRRVGDRGTLVVPRWLAADLGVS